MIRIIAFLSILVLCTAQTRPNIPGTFYATLVVETHRGETRFDGKGYWARNMLTKMAVRNVTFFEDEQHMRETFYRLERYDEHEEYDIRPGPDRHHCSHQDLRGTIQDVWEWVSRAEYNGTVNFEHRTVALWWLHVGDILLAVGVDPDTPNVPVILVEETHMERAVSIFHDFNPATPPARDFEIPRECMQASAGKATPTRALRAGRLRSGRL